MTGLENGIAYLYEMALKKAGITDVEVIAHVEYNNEPNDEESA